MAKLSFCILPQDRCLSVWSLVIAESHNHLETNQYINTLSHTISECLIITGCLMNHLEQQLRENPKKKAHSKQNHTHKNLKLYCAQVQRKKTCYQTEEQGEKWRDNLYLISQLGHCVSFRVWPCLCLYSWRDFPYSLNSASSLSGFFLFHTIIWHYLWSLLPSISPANTFARPVTSHYALSYCFSFHLWDPFIF